MKRFLYLASFLLASSCFSVEMIEISLYTGIPGVAKLGESFTTVVNAARYKHEKAPIDSGSDLGKLGFTQVLEFKEIGARVFFRRDGVGLIVLQEPFRGQIKGKKLRLFSFSTPPVSNWENQLEKEFGEPAARASGGRLGSQSLFFDWGDISYNRMGPNQLALYRNIDLQKYRLKNFGRELTLFPQQK